MLVDETGAPLGDAQLLAMHLFRTLRFVFSMERNRKARTPRRRSRPFARLWPPQPFRFLSCAPVLGARIDEHCRLRGPA
eukprot:6201136-Pleurochrysis_carterae.AAC.1